MAMKKRVALLVALLLLTVSCKKETTPEAAIQTVRAGSVEKISFVLKGKDWNPNNQDYTKYKDALNSSDFFAKHLGKKGPGFVIEGNISPAQADPLDTRKQFITFEIAAHLPEARRQ